MTRKSIEALATSGSTKKAINRILKLKEHPALRRFKFHNRKLFPVAANVARRKPIVLMELNEAYSAHISYSYLANILAEKEQARIVAYAPKSMGNWQDLLYFKIKQALRVEQFGVYKSFGVTGILEVGLSASQKRIAKEIFLDALQRIKNKQDVVELTIKGVWVGDLIYDTYLKIHNEPTIEIESPVFLSALHESIELFVFWEDYFNSHDVRGINVSHCVYNNAMPLRIAVQRDIPAFQSNVTHVYRLNAKNLFAYNEFIHFRKRFAGFPKDVQKAGLKKAESQIKRRFAGKVGVDMAYSSKSAFGVVQKERLLSESPRKKILIATHCFFDSPHSYGKNIFPDFYEWLKFLGEITERTDYDWYIKTHPDYLPGTMEIIQGFLKRYPRFKLLPASASHHQIISEGIDVALTSYGTIGFEYAALGIPVINASINNPHIAYDFNLHPKNIQEYSELLMDLEGLSLSIDKQQVYEYYFMKNIYNTSDIFFDNYQALEASLGGYSGQFTPAVYDRWLTEFTAEKHDALCSALLRFIDSGDFRMNYTHLGRKFTAESVMAET